MKRRRVGKCECGGTVYGVRDFGRLFTWCNKCTPVVRVKVKRPTPSAPTPTAEAE